MADHTNASRKSRNYSPRLSEPPTPPLNYSPRLSETLIEDDKEFIERYRLETK